MDSKLRTKAQWRVWQIVCRMRHFFVPDFSYIIEGRRFYAGDE